MLVLSRAAVAASAYIHTPIPAGPIDQALIDVAMQANLSLGGPLDSCTGVSRPVAVDTEAGDALTLVLSDSNCTYAMPDRATVIVSLRAQPEGRDAAPIPLDEVVVTATRRPDLPGSTPYALTALSGTTLSDRRLSDMYDLVGQAAGMTVTNLGPGRNKVILRGVSDGTFTGLAQSPVAIYLDSSPITYAAPDPDLRLADIDRVEVLRGPQGALYGGGAIGGVIRIIPHAPDLITASGYIKSSLSRTKGGGLNGEVEAAGNIPIVEGRVALRVVAYRETESGYIDDIGREARNVNRSVREGGRAALAVVLGPQWRLTLSGAYQLINTADTHYGFRRLPARVRDQVVREPHDNNFEQARLAVEGRGEWGALSLSATYLSHRFKSRYDATAVMGSFGIRGVGLFDEAKDIGLAAMEATYTSPRNQSVTWLAGAYASFGNTRLMSQLMRIFPFDRDEYDEARKDGTRELAIYGEVSADLSNSVSISAGGRLFQYRFDTASVVSERSMTRSFSGRHVSYGFSPKVVVEYDPAENVILYAQAAGGYRGGGFNTSGRVGQVFDDSSRGIPREYRPDTIWNYEAGAKVRLLDDALQIRIAAFYADWQNIQSDQFQSSGLPFTANVGDGNSRGIEVEANWRVSQNLDVGVAALFQNSDLTKSRDVVAAAPDVGLPGTPDLSGSALVDFHMPTNFGATLRVQGDINYVGHSFLTFDAQRLFEMGGYATARLSVGLEFEAFKATVFVNNLTDNAANTFAFGNPFRMRTDPEVTPMTPRTIGVEISASF